MWKSIPNSTQFPTHPMTQGTSTNVEILMFGCLETWAGIIPSLSKKTTSTQYPRSKDSSKPKNIFLNN